MDSEKRIRSRVFKRYSEFRILHEKVISFYISKNIFDFLVKFIIIMKLQKIKIKIPELPKTSGMLSLQNEKKLKIRQLELQKYLQELVLMKELENNQLLRKFLEMN